MFRFIQSLLLPFSSFYFLFNHKKLLIYAFIPFLLNVIACIAAFILLGDYLWDWIQQYLAQFDAWYWLVFLYFLAVLLFILLIGMTLLIFIVLISIMSAPFNDVLSEKTYEILSGKHDEEPFSLKLLWQDIRRTIGTEIRKTGMIVGIFLLLFVLNLLPGVGTVLWIGGSLLFAIWASAFDYLDYMLSRRRLSFRQKRRYLRQHYMNSFGLGTGIYLILLIPIMNFLFIPVAVVAATRCFYQIELEHGGFHVPS